MTKLHRLMRQGRRIASLAALLLTSTVFAREFLPQQAWLESVKSPAPFIPYRIGLIDCEKGTACSPCGQPTTEYFADIRAALRDANLFDRAASGRLAVSLSIAQEQSAIDSGRNVGTCAVAITYRFRDGDRIAYEHTIRSIALMDAFADATVKSALTANIKMLVLKLRKEGGDAVFLARSATLEKDVAKDLVDHSRSIGGMLTQGFVKTMEGTVAVAQGIGEVGGTVLEAAASPEFQAALQDSLAEQQAAQARQDAMLADIQRQAMAVEEQRKAQEQRTEEMHRARVAMANNSRPVTPPVGQDARAAAGAEQQSRVAADRARQEEIERGRKNDEERRRLAEVERKEKEAERQRLADIERKEKEAERVRLAEVRKQQEELARQQKRRDIDNYYAAESRAIRMRVLNCFGEYHVVGTAPSVKPRRSSCLRVHYEARCPGTQPGQGITDSINTYVGGMSCYGDSKELPVKPSCPADAVTVDVTRVTFCL